MLTFVWDERKAAGNIRKHKVSFAEACSVFADPLSQSTPDPDHSVGEERSIIFGASIYGRLLAVAFAEHGHIVRIISARPATRAERRTYGQL